MENKSWIDAVSFYNDKFGIEPVLVEIMSSIDILRMCVSGASNETISRFLDLPLERVEYIIDSHLEFKGWETDLDSSPLRVYNEGIDTLDDKTKRACEIFTALERLLDEKWI